MKKILHSDNAPAAIGPYVQGVDLGNLVFTSGQIPLNPRTGEVPASIELQTQQSLENVQAVLTAANLTMADIIKTTVFVTDLGQFAQINQVYSDFFAKAGVSQFPARSCVQVARLPKDVGIEIEAIAVRAAQN
ncbi:MAG: RidA family protein [Vibrionaceae bacterium]